MKGAREEDIKRPFPLLPLALVTLNHSLRRHRASDTPTYYVYNTKIPTMKKICILLLHLYLALAAQHQRPAIKKWKSPNHKPGALSKRSVGYQPELGACKDGQETCHDACGDGFEECGAGSYAAVFCYKPDDGETCCYDDEGSKLFLLTHFFPSLFRILSGSNLELSGV